MTSRSADLFAEAKKVIAGGVSRNTLLRDPHPIYVKAGKGCRVTDVDGVERIDFANNMASLIHGHAHPAVVDAVTAQLSRGTAFALATEIEIEFARLLCSRSPGFDKVRFMNSGTEAIMAGLKACRAFTGRSRIAKVEGTYHGAYDYAEVSQAPSPHSWGEADRPSSVPLAKGTPEGVLRDVLVLPFNRPGPAIEVLDQHRDEIAGVLIDLMPHRVGFVPASTEFVRALREWTSKNGAVLLFDEVITFRTELGGMQARYGVQPDLTAMGKIIGGGFPVGALAGSDELMGVFFGDGGPKLPQSGTFSANPTTMTAGHAAMGLYDADAIARLNALGRRARDNITEAISVAGARASVTGTGSVYRIHMKSEPPTDYRTAFLSSDEKALLDRFVAGLYDEGIVPLHTGAGMLSTPMAEAEVDRLGDAVLASLRRL